MEKIFTNQDLIDARLAQAQPTIENLTKSIQSYLIGNVGMLSGKMFFLNVGKTADVHRVHIMLVCDIDDATEICEIKVPENCCWNFNMKIWVAKQILQHFGAAADEERSATFQL